MSDYEPPMPIMKAVAASISQDTEQNSRTRDEQVANLVEALSDEVWLPDHKSYCEKMLAEAEARGAAEAVLKMSFSTEQKAIEERKAGKRGEAFWRVCLINALTDPEGRSNEEAQSHIDLLISEFKQIGAEEQRRKDAEASDEAIDEVMAERDNAEEFIRKFAERVLGHSVEWSSSYGFGSAFIDVADRVAALEARVKELEAVISAMRPGSVRTTIHSPTRFMDDARAALTREGGV